jgi:hypothetical protein
MDMLIIRDMSLQVCMFQPSLRIYSWDYIWRTINAFEGAQEERFHRMHREKEITDDGTLEAY